MAEHNTNGNGGDARNKKSPVLLDHLFHLTLLQIA
jgi:hypothetical protein